MRRLTRRNIGLLTTLITSAVWLSCVWTQPLTAQSTTTSTNTDVNGTPVPNTTTTTGTGTGNTAATNPNPGSGTGGSRPIFLSGVVMMDDGLPLPTNVNIQSICSTARRTMGHVSDTGSFGFQWSNMIVAFGDASQMGKTPGTGSASLTGTRNGSRGLDPLANCDLLAEAPGYVSTRASLYGRQGQDNYDVGAIILHRIASGDGHTVSILALQAPKDAKKSFDKGMSLAASNKLADALASFEAAITVYPLYADAWLEMGKVQWRVDRKDEARASFAKARDLDSKLVGPWQELGFLACDEARWEEAVRDLDQAVHLDPINSPIPWYFDALANYNLGRYEQAEQNIRAELRLDQGKNPQAHYLLGLVLIARQDLVSGAEALRNYIASSPSSPDVATARRELSRVENRIGK